MSLVINFVREKKIKLDPLQICSIQSYRPTSKILSFCHIFFTIIDFFSKFLRWQTEVDRKAIITDYRDQPSSPRHLFNYSKPGRISKGVTPVISIRWRTLLRLTLRTIVKEGTMDSLELPSPISWNQETLHKNTHKASPYVAIF